MLGVGNKMYIKEMVEVAGGFSATGIGENPCISISLARGNAPPRSKAQRGVAPFLAGLKFTSGGFAPHAFSALASGSAGLLVPRGPGDLLRAFFSVAALFAALFNVTRLTAQLGGIRTLVSTWHGELLWLVAES